MTNEVNRAHLMNRKDLQNIERNIEKQRFYSTKKKKKIKINSYSASQLINNALNVINSSQLQNKTHISLIKSSGGKFGGGLIN